MWGRRAAKTRPPAAIVMRFLLRFIGLWLLAGAFVALIIDGPSSIAGGPATLYLRQFPRAETGGRDVHVQEKPRDAERRRRATGARDADPDREPSFRQRPGAQTAVPRGAGDRDLRARLLLGRRAQILGARRRHPCHRGRLRGWPHAQPHLPGGLHRTHRPQRGGARGVRPEQDFLPAAVENLLGEPRPYA